ncbi:ABC transporter [Streptococcus bovimastitidis]|uniref:ABC transporter n=1 Tax=Streptococcus bovimastitidis TaxID=1856638 RepID=A0A1L8MN46_9STRE|nr:ABC transporter ATP-binding protein [Streptococcus bovimastitidis]OJF72200.1 ABC transporter [Streptococcus bovimastitidis]
MKNKIEIKHLNKKYSSFALKDVNFTVPKGFVTGFIGKNGMGKTTTIKSILSLIHYDGDIEFGDSELGIKIDNQKIGVIMDDSFLAKDWNMDLVNNAMKVGYDEWDETLFQKYLSDFSIDRKLKVKELSRGMKIKLMLAIALSHHADVLILDEPTSGLDPSMREELMEIISDYMQDENHSVLFSTHITQDLEAIADYIVFIDDGKIVLSLEKDDFMNYFMILKCDIQNQFSLNESLVLGRKKTKYQIEYLVKRSEVDEIPEGYLEDHISIDRIMILFRKGV